MDKCDCPQMPTEAELTELIADMSIPHLEAMYREGWQAGYEAGLAAARAEPPPTFAMLLEAERRAT